VIARRSAMRMAADTPLALRLRREGIRHPEPPARFRHGHRRPVVLLPGVYETWRFLGAIAERVSAAGHPVHVLPELGVNAASIPRTAAHVADALRRRGLDGVALVAHSKGGLVGKLVMLGEEGTRVDRLIAIASPFAGSRIARYTLLPSLRAFRPAHPVIRELATGRDVDARITSIFPTFDPHIPDGSRLEGATNVEIAVEGHFRILVEPATADAVLAALAD
jgi:alpha-beta hydrolase superfamily lysophospholipase